MKQFLLMTVIAFTIAGCSKDDNNIPQLPAPAPLDDARTVLLKEVVAQTLPNPYFHFTYDSLHYVTLINFASGLSIYTVEYENKRVKKMTNIKNGNTILYSYNNKRVAEINEFSVTGSKMLNYQFSYNNSNQLTQVLWFEFSTNSTGNLFKKAILSYQADGNLAVIDHYYTSTGEMTLGSSYKYSDYDNKTNVDDFYLLEDFFDTYLFLPQVKMQKNNPRKLVITGPQNDYDIVYSYQYNNNLPTRKTGMMTQTRGSGNGHTIQITNLFNYY